MTAFPGLLELSSESLKECLEIIESYIILGGEAFIGGRHGSDLALAISSLITDVRDECLVMVSRLIEMMLRVSIKKVEFFENLFQILFSFMHYFGFQLCFVLHSSGRGMVG